MKLTLIKPTIGLVLKDPQIPDGKPFVDKARMEPLQLGVLAGLTPPDVEVAFYDDRCEKIPFDEPTDLVALTVEIFTAQRAYEIAAEYRKRNIPVILGGIHPSVVPDESSHFADSVFIGDAELLWAEVIEDARNRRLKKVYRSRPGPAQNGTFPDRGIFKNKGYLPLSLIQFGRGCRFSCSYCITSLYFNKTCFYRQVDRVIREIGSYPGKLWFFVDDNFVSEKKLAKELMQAMIPLKIKWVGQASIEMVSDPELMTLMQKSGCLGHVMGFESMTKEGLTSMNKMHNLESGLNYDETIRIITDYGMAIWAAFILGTEEDTTESLLNILEFSLKHKFAFAAFNVLMPYPNTEFYKQLKAEN
ncbi:MAG: radical SAM protein, partial [Bacteroidales bacterium]|nr:radical SAM protein [Bacteroidales bacterium]